MLYRFDKLVGSGDVTFVLSMDEIEPFFLEWTNERKEPNGDRKKKRNAICCTCLLQVFNVYCY